MNELAMFGAGCFWGVEQSFRQVEGVLDIEVGYTGGKADNPGYKDVCSGKTGHAEVVHIEFDPNVVSFEDILEVFWNIHDPTTLNRQGPDVGSQYRSVIFYYDDKQRKAAENSKQDTDVSGRFGRPIVTEIRPAGRFWRAEEYHQRYFEKNRARGCRICGSGMSSQDV